MEAMQNFELVRQSQMILSELGQSLTKIFDPSNMEPDPVIESLLKKLDEIPSSREVSLERSNERLCRLLSKKKD